MYNESLWISFNLLVVAHDILLTCYRKFAKSLRRKFYPHWVSLFSASITAPLDTHYWPLQHVELFMSKLIFPLRFFVSNQFPPSPRHNSLAMAKCRIRYANANIVIKFYVFSQLPGSSRHSLLAIARCWIFACQHKYVYKVLCFQPPSSQLLAFVYWLLQHVEFIFPNQSVRQVFCFRKTSPKPTTLLIDRRKMLQVFNQNQDANMLSVLNHPRFSARHSPLAIATCRILKSICSFPAFSQRPPQAPTLFDGHRRVSQSLCQNNNIVIQFLCFQSASPQAPTIPMAHCKLFFFLSKRIFLTSFLFLTSVPSVPDTH